MPSPKPGEKSWRSGPPERAEITIAFADRRAVNFVLIPYRITTSARSVTTGQQQALEEPVFEKVFVNPPLSAADFERVPY